MIKSKCQFSLQHLSNLTNSNLFISIPVKQQPVFKKNQRLHLKILVEQAILIFLIYDGIS